MSQTAISSHPDVVPLPGARVVVVLGVGHSGTTILYRMLAMHPEVTWFSQYSLRGGEIPGRTRVPLGAWLDTSLRRAFPHDWRKRPRGVCGVLAPVPSEGYAIWRYLLPDDDPSTPEEAIRRLREGVGAECRRAGRRILVAKMSRLSRHTGMLSAAFPQAAFVHVVRDGRAVAVSLKEKRRFRHAPDATARLLLAAEYWRDEVAVAAAAPEGRMVTDLRYEDLCADVHGTLERILLAIGLPPSVFPFARVPGHLLSTNPDRLRMVPSDVLRRIEQVQRPWLERYRYV